MRSDWTKQNQRLVGRTTFFFFNIKKKERTTAKNEGRVHEEEEELQPQGGAERLIDNFLALHDPDPG